MQRISRASFIDIISGTRWWATTTSLQLQFNLNIERNDSTRQISYLNAVSPFDVMHMNGYLVQLPTISNHHVNGEVIFVEICEILIMKEKLYLIGVFFKFALRYPPFFSLVL